MWGRKCTDLTQLCWHPSQPQCRVAVASSWDPVADLTQWLSLDGGIRDIRLSIAGLGKEQKSKSKIWFLPYSHCFHTRVKWKKNEANRPKSRATCICIHTWVAGLEKGKGGYKSVWFYKLAVTICHIQFFWNQNLFLSNVHMVQISPRSYFSCSKFLIFHKFSLWRLQFQDEHMLKAQIPATFLGQEVHLGILISVFI